MTKPQRERKIANQIRQEEYRAVEQRDDDHLATRKIARNVAGHQANVVSTFVRRDRESAKCAGELD